MRTFSQSKLLDWAYLFHWARREDFVRVICGQDKRHKAIEYNLPVLVKRRQLKRRRWGRQYVYALPGTNGRSACNLEHGLRCTDALVRFHLSKAGEYVSEREFRAGGSKPVPEFGVRYGGDTAVLLLFEYSSADNFRRKKLMEKKVRAYVSAMVWFSLMYEAEPYLVCVIDANESEVERFAGRFDRNYLYFADAHSFYSAPYGQQLSSQIYLWRGEKVSLDA